jgi:membrane-associated phospholipid phosphatase
MSARIHRNGSAAVFALWLVLAPCAVYAAAPDTTKAAHPPITPANVTPHPPVPHLFTPGDLAFLGGTVAAVSVAVFNDRWLTGEAVETQDNLKVQNVAKAFQPLGNPAPVLAASMLVYGSARWINHPQLARRAARVGLAVTLAGGVTMGLKEALGRERPYQSPDQSNNFKPFSGHNSFPSGHAATAFAAAVALDRETTGRWVPWVVYPAATAVAWSRVQERQHWTSDVVAGAAIGGWVAWKTETFLAHRALGVAPGGRRTSFLLAPRDGTVQLVMVHSLN